MYTIELYRDFEVYAAACLLSCRYSNKDDALTILRSAMNYSYKKYHRELIGYISWDNHRERYVRTDFLTEPPTCEEVYK